MAIEGPFELVCGGHSIIVHDSDDAEKHEAEGADGNNGSWPAIDLRIIRGNGQEDWIELKDFRGGDPPAGLENELMKKFIGTTAFLHWNDWSDGLPASQVNYFCVFALNLQSLDLTLLQAIQAKLEGDLKSSMRKGKLIGVLISTPENFEKATGYKLTVSR
jgi:hypothetical protein